MFKVSYSSLHEKVHWSIQKIDLGRGSNSFSWKGQQSPNKTFIHNYSIKRKTNIWRQ